MQDTLEQACAQARAELYENVRRRADLGGNAKVVFFWLVPLVASGINPGIRVIARECGVNHKTAARALEQLRDAGLLDWTPGPNGCGRTYRIVPEVHAGPSALCDGETLTITDEYGSVTLTRADWRRVATSPTGEYAGLRWKPWPWGGTSVETDFWAFIVDRERVRQWVETGVYPKGDSC